MRKAMMLVIQHVYRDEDSIESVLGYAIDSRFAIFEKAIAGGLRCNTFDDIVNEFHRIQEPYEYLNNHRKLFHFVLTTTNHKTKERTLDEGAYALAAFLEEKGHPFLMVPHFASATNPEHYHWHVVVNVKSYKTHQSMLDKYSTYAEIKNYLNQNPHTEWRWAYRKGTKMVFLNEL